MGNKRDYISKFSITYYKANTIITNGIIVA